MTNPAPRPALRKAPDADVHPARAGDSTANIDLRAAAPTRPAVSRKVAAEGRNRAQVSASDTSLAAADLRATGQLAVPAEPEAEKAAAKEPSKKKDKKNKKGKKGKKKNGQGSARADQRIDVRVAVPRLARHLRNSTPTL